MEVFLGGFVVALQQIAPVLYGLAVAALLDTVTGVYAAWKGGTFDANFLPAFIRSHILEKIIPILIVLGAGVALGGTAGPALIALGGAAGAAYVASVVKSISDNLGDARNEAEHFPTT